MVPSFSWASCLNLNEGVVHGVPSKKKQKKVICSQLIWGFFIQGYHTDMSRSLLVGEDQSKDKERFILTGKQVLNQAIGVAKSGNRIGHLSTVIESGLEKEGLFPG